MQLPEFVHALEVFNNAPKVTALLAEWRLIFSVYLLNLGYSHDQTLELVYIEVSEGQPLLKRLDLILLRLRCLRLSSIASVTILPHLRDLI